MWAYVRPRHRAATVRLSPRTCAAEWLGYVAVMTKINYIHWKTFLVFFSSRRLHTSFFMPLGVVQMCATLKRDDEGGVLSENILEGDLAPHRSQVSHWTLWGNVLAGARFIHISKQSSFQPAWKPGAACFRAHKHAVRLTLKRKTRSFDFSGIQFNPVDAMFTQ